MFGLGLLVSQVGVSGQSAAEEEHFENRIRPLLEQHCVRCHGVKKQEGGLRLDSRAGWQKGGEGGAVILPGRPEESALIRAVRYGDKDLQMPPKKRLSAEQVADLERWVAGGAKDPRSGSASVFNAQDFESGKQWWSFQPVRKPVVAEVAGDCWSRTPIDRWIAARLQGAGLRPAKAADRRTLLRRVTFDLIGLPPTSEEVEEFERDPEPTWAAFAKVVDRLLASAHYGEHWARHWLDLARYSDTKGYVYAREEKRQVHAWVYRDWVVQALNEDLPYDRFLELQIAADQLESENSPHLAAMGFLTLGRRFLGVTHDIIDDRIDVLMRTTQGLSVGCARCHDHKFDPIPTADYYSLYGVFQSCAEKLVASGRDESLHGEFEEELRTREVDLKETLAGARRDREAQLRRSAKEYLIAQLELEKYPEESFTQILGAGDIHPLNVRRWQHYLARTAQREDPVFLPWHRFAALSSEQFEREAVRVIEELGGLKKEVLHPEVAKAFETVPSSMREVAERYGALLAAAEGRAAEAAKKGVMRILGGDALHAVLYGPDSPCAVPDEDLVNIEWFFPTALVVNLWKKQGELDRFLVRSQERVPFANILVDRPEPAVARVFKRGNPLAKGEAVPRRFLRVLSEAEAPAFAVGSGRLELARKIASSRNPLTARVMVNRVWMHHFGRGLVSTPSDFGRRGEVPSHPELLDWLAAQFMEEGWSLKRLHRWMLLSAAYQQESAAPDDVRERERCIEMDPENRLLWRMNTRKLSFEQLRDGWLAASGELDQQVGGKPLDLFAGTSLRRSLYGFIDRETLPSALRTFDFANPDLSIPVRNDTLVPQQALFSLNHPFLMGRVRALVRRVESSGPSSDVERVQRLYAFVFQRAAEALEVEAALGFMKSAKEAAGGFSGGHAKSPGPLEELAQMLLVSNEFVFVD